MSKGSTNDKQSKEISEIKEIGGKFFLAMCYVNGLVVWPDPTEAQRPTGEC